MHIRGRSVGTPGTGSSADPLASDAFAYRWRIRTRLPERFGQSCKVTARGRLNSIRVEFPDGFWVITSRWSVRRDDQIESLRGRGRRAVLS